MGRRVKRGLIAKLPPPGDTFVNIDQGVLELLANKEGSLLPGTTMCEDTKEHLSVCAIGLGVGGPFINLHFQMESPRV